MQGSLVSGAPPTSSLRRDVTKLLHDSEQKRPGAGESQALRCGYPFQGGPARFRNPDRIEPFAHYREVDPGQSERERVVALALSASHKSRPLLSCGAVFGLICAGGAAEHIHNGRDCEQMQRACAGSRFF
jgi:hypothetical protein